MHRVLPIPTVLLGVMLLACSSDDGPAEPELGELVVQVRALSALPVSGASSSSAAPGDVTRYDVTFYQFYMAENADCSSPVLLGDRPSGFTVDILTDPVLFEVTGERGTYDCIVMRLSDVFTFVPETSFGPCVAGTAYTVDTYRTGFSDFRDVDGNPIEGNGSDAAPVDDRVDFFFSTDPSAVAARGFSPMQITPLVSGAVIPGTSTFAYDMSGVATDQGGECRSGGGVYTFR